MSYGSQSHQPRRERIARAADGHPRDAEPYAHHYHHPQSHAVSHVRGRAPSHREGGAQREPAARVATARGRQVRIGRIAFWVIVGSLVVLAGWTTVTATYLAFRDDVLRRLVRHQAEVQFSYEDQIAEMRARIERATSRQMLDQEQLAAKLEQLVRRQSVLEGRANMLGTLTDPNAAKSHNPAPSRPPSAAAPIVARVSNRAASLRCSRD